MATIELKNDIPLLEAAATAAGLQLLSGSWKSSEPPMSPQSLPQRIREEALESGQTPPCQYLLRVSPESARSFVKTPYEVYVYQRGDSLLLAWEDHEDGFGLLAFLGAQGERLRVFFVIEAVHKALGSRPWNCITQTCAEEYVTITYEDTMSQKKITVRIDPKGGTTIKTEGFEGASCKDATAALERELGIVESDVATSDMYKTQEQAAEITTTGG